MTEARDDAWLARIGANCHAVRKAGSLLKQARRCASKIDYLYLMNNLPYVVSGGAGFVGRALVRALRDAGHRVYVLSTQAVAGREDTIFWDTEKGEIDSAFRCGDCKVINLAGAGVADARWTKARKALIRDSRVNSLNTLRLAHERGQMNITQLVSASAIGYYGNATGVQTETSPGDPSFLSTTCQDWEKAALQFETLFGIPVSIARIGIVMYPSGGALKALTQTFPWHVAGLPGSGRQIYSWIHRDDLVKLLMWLSEEEKRGIYNAVAPKPVGLGALMRSAVKASGKWIITVPAPAFAIRLLLGEMAIEVLKSTEVSSAKIQGQGFQFKYPDIDSAMRHLFS